MVSLVAGLLAGGASPAEARAGQPTGTTVVATHSGQALDVTGVSQAAGTQVIQWPGNGQPNQRWTFEPLGDGTYRIVVGHSGQVLDVAGASHAQGARVIQWPWNGGANQRWRVEDVGGQGKRIVAVHSGQVLDVAGASHAQGARVIQWPWNGGANQRWERTDDGNGDGGLRLTQLCTHEARGVTVAVQYPEGWSANDPSVQPCSAFDPEPFSIEPGTQYPRDLAVVILVEPFGFETASSSGGVQVQSEGATTIDGRQAVRQVVVTTGEGLGPAGQESTRYVIDAGTDRSILAYTYNVAGNDYGRSVDALDAMANAFAVDPVDDGGLDGDDVLAPGIDAGPEVADGGPPAVVVTDVRLGRHNGFDRIVFDIGGQGQAGWDIRYVDQARSAGSGQPVDVGGDAILQVNLSNIALPTDAPDGV
ncbi:MAG: RICIN domain-containing protein, partial [Acidimicrobiales bacterium]